MPQEKDAREEFAEHCNGEQGQIDFEVYMASKSKEMIEEVKRRLAEQFPEKRG